MTTELKKITVPLKIQGRSYTGRSSVEEIVIYLLEKALEGRK